MTELATREYCHASHDHDSCPLELGHDPPHRVPGGPGRPDIVWYDAEPDLETGELVVNRLPSDPHDFPEKRIYSKVCRARSRYLCVSIDPAPGHTSIIYPGTQYLRVMLRPAKKKRSGGWRARPLCAACAVQYRLASIEAAE